MSICLYLQLHLHIHPSTGKFDHAHRESSNILNLQIFPGAKLSWAYPTITGTEEERMTGNFDKQMTFLPVISLGGPEGSSAMLNVITQLGHVSICCYTRFLNFQCIDNYTPLNDDDIIPISTVKPI